MEGYVRSEYGNLWETHQCRPHAFGHTWSPGYELPAGLLHGHAVATCMGYGSYLAKEEGFITAEMMHRIMRLINDMELTLYHEIMDNHELIHAANLKVHAKRGGNLCAPVPKDEIGQCGYINHLSRERLDKTVDEYKEICMAYPRNGAGVDMHLKDVGLDDTSVKHRSVACSHKKHRASTNSLKSLDSCVDSNSTSSGQGNSFGSYKEWIESMQKERNADWKMNVSFECSPDTETPPSFKKFTLFEEGVEKYAMAQTSLASKSVQNIAKLTQEKAMFAPCMVGTLESQFLKMQCQIKGAMKCLDVGTFTGMSAIAMAEGMAKDGKVVTLENDIDIARAAQEGFDMSPVGDKIELVVGNAAEHMRKLLKEGEKFDIIFLDADKENYVEYYDLAMNGLLAKDGLILADNTMCALLYDDTDIRSQKLHEFNQKVKNDPRVEQVVLTLREGVTLIRQVAALVD